LFYREEANRGESSLDDLYQPGYFEVPISSQGIEFAVVAAADVSRQECGKILESFGSTTLNVKRSLELELKQRADSLTTFYDSQKRVPVSDWLNWVLQAADSFIVQGSGDTRSVIAGYHWFEAWGRDTFISLPGLLLVTGRFADAERVLLNFAKHVKHGLIPNLIPDKLGQKPAYNTVDATLWYVNAVLQYVKYTGDYRFVEENLWETLKTIIENHERGTAFGIRADSDGLLSHGPRLTWMDAEVDGEAMTPRAGKAVEVQALWYNTLRTVQLLAARFRQQSLSWRCADMASKTRGSFDRKFWNREKGCLFDVVESSGVDASLRPNQIIAAALDFPILYRDKADPVVNMVQRELLTPFGLRTLSRNDPRYRGIYEGNHASRDRAYHNGTVWPWLLGPFTTAFLKAKGGEADNREFALTNFLTPLFSTQLFQAGLGTISEIFDGDPPHTPRGCISQAWSVAEPLRAYVEDALQVRPKFEKEVLQLRSR
jgi:predicted glycogen debranching enzyme